MILVPLLHRLAQQWDDDEVARFFWGFVKSVSHFVSDVIVATSDSPIKKQVGKLIDRVQGIPETEKKRVASIPKSRAHAIAETFDALVKHVRMRTKKDRLVIAIDNLDRCRPSALRDQQ